MLDTSTQNPFARFLRYFLTMLGSPCISPARVGNVSVQKPNKNRILANCLEDCFLIFITSLIQRLILHHGVAEPQYVQKRMSKLCAVVVRIVT
jgi:hypothetical protein